jgi:hypothetical protein
VRSSVLGLAERAGEREILSADSIRAAMSSDLPFGLWRPRWRFLVQELPRRRREAISTAPSPDLELWLLPVSRAMHVDQGRAALLLNDQHPQVRPIGNSELR